MDGNNLATTTLHSSIIDWSDWGNKKEQNLFCIFPMSDVMQMQSLKKNDKEKTITINLYKF
jgi:hypothetical protein